MKRTRLSCSVYVNLMRVVFMGEHHVIGVLMLYLYINNSGEREWKPPARQSAIKA